MTTSNSKGKELAVMSAICYMIFTLYSIIPRFKGAFSGTTFNTVYFLLLWICLIGLTVSIFIRNKKAVMIFAIINTVVQFYEVFTKAGYGFSPMIEIFDVVAYLLFIMLLSLNANKSRTIKKLYLIPGAIALLKCILILLLSGAGKNWGMLLFSKANENWEIFVFLVVESGALFYAGFWLNDDIA